MRDADVLSNARQNWTSAKRAANGSYVAPSAPACIRACLHLCLIAAPVGRTVNMLSDYDFVSSNRMLKAAGACSFVTAANVTRSRPCKTA